MDGTTFDELIKRLATTPLSRSKALRGLAASVSALAGVTLAAEPGAARGKRTICHCTDEKSTSCKTKEVGRRAARRHIRKHDCDYRHECKGRSGCCFADTQACTTDTQCCSGFCGDGTCRPVGSCVVQGAACNDTNMVTSDDCCTGECLDGLCRPTGSCKELGEACGSDNSLCCSGFCGPINCEVGP
jgi:hypothetical protein